MNAKTLSRRLAAGATAALLVLSAAGSAHAAPVIDGGFESPVVPAGGFTTFGVGTDINLPGGWRVVGNPFDAVAIVSGTLVDNGVAYMANSGSQWLDLTGAGSNRMNGVEQTIPTVAGQKYQIRFAVGALAGTSSTVGVYANLVHTCTLMHNNVASSGWAWKRFQCTFTATGSASTIRFMNFDPWYDQTNGLDSVSVRNL